MTPPPSHTTWRRRVSSPLPVGCVPDFERLVVARADDPCPVGTPGHARNATGVSLECDRLLPSRCVPDFDRLVVAPADDSLTVGIECHARNVTSVPLERES